MKEEYCNPLQSAHSQLTIVFKEVKCNIHTCEELRIVNIHASAVLYLLMVSNPNTHVSPNRGSKTSEDFRSDLRVADL